MEPREVEQRLATVRLHAALVDHVLAVEEMPDEVSEHARALYDQRGQT